jgi:hypothetical protein
MPTTALLGATGVLGRRVAARLVEDGHDLLLVVRDAAAAERLVGPVAPAARIVTIGPDADADAWRARLTDADLVVSALASADGAAGRAIGGAVDAGLAIVDAADDARHLRAVHALHDRARVRGAVVVPGIGWRTALGDLLTAVAARRLDAPREVHVAVVVPGRGGVIGSASPGVRAGIAASLGDRVLVVDRGVPIEEAPGETRRLAWFPRPFGPHHAAGVPGLEPLSVPRHLPEVTTVRSYVALSSARAELLQAVATLARQEWVRRRVAAHLRRPRETHGARWAVVAEVAGAGDQLARAWANGHDHLDASARLVAAVAGAVRDRRPPAGVLAPAQAGDPRELLDAVAAASEVRWSVADPRGR